MKTIYFATSNQEKIQMAEAICAEKNISVKAVSLEIDEIQGEDPELIVRDKAMRAYEQLKMPIVVSDDTWGIRALNGFPGAYMKSMNYWFQPEDFLRLMHGVEDRHITLHQYLAYTDGDTTEIFKNDIEGQIIHKARGKNKKTPSKTVIALDSDNGKTLAEVFEQDTEVVTARYKDRPEAWHNLVEWYSNNH